MEEFNSLNDININLGGIAWDQFVNARKADIDGLLNTQNIHGPQRVVVVDLWRRHANITQQGKIYLILIFLLLYLILDFALYICFL
jgi:hypothetical protein